jgi:16S rRNA processing protein RimM
MSKAEVSTRFLSVGRIRKSFGKEGEVLVRLRADISFHELAGLAIWLVPPPLTGRVGRSECVQARGEEWLVKFSQIYDRDMAQAASGCSLLIETADLSPEVAKCLRKQISAAGAQQTPAALGLTVLSDNYGALGTVAEVIQTGANDVWVLRGGPFGEILLPVIASCVKETDFDKATARVHVLPGLIDV